MDITTDVAFYVNLFLQIFPEFAKSYRKIINPRQLAFSSLVLWELEKNIRCDNIHSIGVI